MHIIAFMKYSNISLLYKFNNLPLVSVNLIHIYMLYMLYVFITKMAVSVIKFSIGQNFKNPKNFGEQQCTRAPNFSVFLCVETDLTSKIQTPIINNGFVNLPLLFKN